MSIKPILTLRGNYTNISSTDTISGGFYDGFPFRWDVTFNIIAQSHGDDTTTSPFEYNALDVAVGDWVLNDVGQAVKIISIDNINTNSTTLVCNVEDVDLFNINSNSNANGDGFTTGGNVIVFKTDDEDKLVTLPIDSFNIPQEFYINAISRFQYTTSAQAFGLSEVSATSLIESYGFLTEASANDLYVNEGDLSALGQFNNDVGYITEASAQDLLGNFEGDRILGYNGDNFVIASAESNTISMGTNGQTVITITASGNVGIGTETPNAKLEIFNASAESSFIQFTTQFTGQTEFGGAIIGIVDENSDLTLQNNEDGKIKLITNNIDGLVVDASGNVGIKTSAPTETFEVVGTAKFSQVIIEGETTYKLPTSAGTSGLVLTTDGNGNTNWVDTQVTESTLGAGEAVIASITNSRNIQQRSIRATGAIQLSASPLELVLSAAPNPTLLSELVNDLGYITEASANDVFVNEGDLSALSQFVNDVGYITETSVQSLIASISASDVSAISQLTDDIGLVTIDTATSVISQLVNDAGYITEASANAAFINEGDLSALSQFTNDAGYITEASAQALIASISASDVSAVSQLTNDVGYITEASAISLLASAGATQVEETALGTGEAFIVSISGLGDIQHRTILANGAIELTSTANEIILSAAPNPTLLSELTNDVGYITEASAQALIAAISASDVSALSQLTDDVGFVTIDTATSVISQLVNDAGYITEASANLAFVNEGDLSAVSQFVNDAGYITEGSAQALVDNAEVSALSQLTNDQGFVSAAQITALGYITEVSADAAYVAQGDLSAVSQFVNDVGYITEASAQALVDNAEVSALSQLIDDIGVVTIDTATSVLSQLVNDAGYITEISANALFVNEGDLSALSQFTNDAGYITEVSAVALIASISASDVSAVSQLTNDAGYITEVSAQALIDAVEISALSQLTDDIGVVTIDTATSVISQLVNDAGYITEASANLAFVNEGDLSALSQFTNDVGYITEASAVALIASISASDVSAVSQLTNDAGYITETSAQALVDNAEVSALSQLTNDVGYITEASANLAFVNEGDLSALSQFVNDQGFVSAAQITALGYITEVSADAAYVAQGDLSAVSQLTNDVGYITEASAVALIASVSASDVSAISQLIDDVGLVTINTATSVLSQLVNDAGYITEISANALFVNEGDLSALSQFTNDVGYITEASAVSLLATVGATQVEHTPLGAGESIIASISGLGDIQHKTLIAGGAIQILSSPTEIIISAAPNPTLVSDLTNDVGYITEASAQALVDNAEVSALSQLTNDQGFVSAAQITALGYITEASADAAYVAQGELSAVSQFVNDTGYITEASAQSLVDAAEVSALSQLTDDIGVVTIDTATSVLSQLVNDAGYITEASANLAFVNEGDLSALSQFINDVDYITEASAVALIASVSASDVSAISQLIDDVGLVTINTATSVLSQLVNDAGYITEISANALFVNEGDLSALSQFDNDQGFVSANQFVGGGIISVSVSGDEITVSANNAPVEFEVILSGQSVGTNFTATEYRTEFSNVNGEQITVSADNNVAVVTHYIPRLYSLRVNCGAATGVDSTNPVSALPTGWTLLSATSTTASLSHNVGANIRQVTFKGFSNTNGYRIFGGGATVFILEPNGFEGQQLRINIGSTGAALSENNGHVIIELIF